jgi:phage terminase small subunit
MSKQNKFKNEQNKRNLTPRTLDKYKRIIDEWFVNKFNGAAAYRAFYPKIKKEETATVNFSKIQALPEVKAYILEKHQEAAKVVNMTHEGILKELQNWIEADITETISLSAEQIKALPVEVRRLITKYKTRLKHFYDKDGQLLNTEETIELHFVSKERAIDMMNKHLGFYEADNKQKATEINIHASNEKHMTIVSQILNGE